jgi:formylglycine-generating enzyme required for sulfatase activity
LNNIDKIYPMVAISGGTFFMGEGDDRHQVTLSPYQIGKYEVTQELWEAVMGDNHSVFKGARKPITNVSWNYCQEFIKKLNQITGKDFRLPTEAEWEFAARGGVSEKSSEYSGSNNLAEVGWYDANSGQTTHNVGRKNSNKLGLYDMSGNINEWCLDWHGHYSADSIVDPIGPKEGYQRVARGGSWKSYESDCGVSKRYRACPYNSYDNYGMRLCVSSSFKGNYSGIIKGKPKKAVVAPRRSYDIPNIIWRVILTAGLMVVMWAIYEFIGRFAPVVATPALVAIWNGSCDIF